jgi:hypothetical protein
MIFYYNTGTTAHYGASMTALAYVTDGTPGAFSDSIHRDTRSCLCVYTHTRFTALALPDAVNLLKV